MVNDDRRHGHMNETVEECYSDCIVKCAMRGIFGSLQLSSVVLGLVLGALVSGT